MRYTVEVNEHGTFWYKEGTDILHRENGPALEFFNGTKRWLLNGKHHRENGPAVEYPDGTKFWYLNGEQYSSEQEYRKALDNLNNTCDNKVIEWFDGKKYELVPLDKD